MMPMRHLMAALAASVLLVGLFDGATAQNAKPKSDAKSAPLPAAAAKQKGAPPKQDAKPAPAAAGSAEPTLAGQFGTWGAYSATPNGKKVCFALAKPASQKSTPPNAPRNPAYAFVSTRPAEKVVNEVSVMVGYPLKPGSDATLEIGSARYAMYVQGDGLWIKNAAEEEAMVDAMRKGADVTVKGVSAKGTQTIDVFSMKGLAQALDRVSQDCRR